MFFSLSKQPDPRFPLHDRIGSWCFSHDKGWLFNNDIWSKGYMHAQISHGNFVKISLSDNKIVIGHDRYRSFPLWWDDVGKTLTNFLGQGVSIWADTEVCLTDDGIYLEKVDIFGEIEISLISRDDLICKVINNLKLKAQALDRDYAHLQKKLFVSGGVDTLTLLAMTTKFDIECSLIDYEHFEYDHFLNLNFKQIRENHWAYNQMHHWRDPCMLLTGGCGDEFMFRGPYTIALWAAWTGINLEEIIHNRSGYMIGYLKKDKNIKIIKDFYIRRNEIQSQYADKSDLIKQILNVNANDHQHWHLGNTLTWTPFKDLELTKLILRLSDDDLLWTICNAGINHLLIEKLAPEYLSLISRTKNHNPRENLYKLFNT